MPPTDLEGGTTPDLVVPSSKMVGKQKGAQVSDLISYPFVDHNFFLAGSANQNGFLGGSMFQDLVIRASSGVLQFPDLYGSIGNSSCMVDTSGDVLGDTHTRPTNMVDQDHPCTLDSSRNANTDYGDGGVAENVKERVEVPSAETDTDMDIEVVAGEGIQDISDLNGEQDLKILPKWKRLPKGAPDGCQTRLMSPIERALRNAPSRKTKYIFEPSPGTKFNCLTEAQEFYNIYSWEVGFGTKKGDKREDRMQEFHCQCKGSDNRVQYKTMKKNCPANGAFASHRGLWMVC